MESFKKFEEESTASSTQDDRKTESSTAQVDNARRPTEALESSGIAKGQNIVDPQPAPKNGEAPNTGTSDQAQTYPSLLHNPPESPKATPHLPDDDDDDDLDLTKSFHRASSPSPGALHRNRGAVVHKVGEEGVKRMHKFTLYETANYFYILGADLLDSSFRIIKIDRTAESGELSITEDDIVYTRRETSQILNAIDEGNRATGGLKLKTAFWGLVGFIRFTGPYYMIYVTKRSQVAMIGGHYIYQIDKTDMVSLTTAAQAKSRNERQMEESRFISILKNLDLSRSFYFSYSYDVTRTLQYNIMREREALQQGLAEPEKKDHNDMFVWNHHLLGPAKVAMRNPYDWCVSAIHGYVDQSGLSIYWGRTVYVTIIARRSRFFAGARFLKRGANDLGYVANDVETEQIVSEMLTTSFHAPGPQLFANPKYTSHVQHRGSIPLYWAQDNTGVSPKPDIQLNVVDPFFSAAALHFDNLFQRYGTPIYVLNLIKSRERTPRESKLLKEYTVAINYLNQFLPQDKQILYHAWDMSRASKSRDQDVIGSLESIAEEILPKTGFFQNGNDTESGLKLQSGVARTNCIDCLDRTNAAQFVIAKKALGYQLQALGVIENTSVEYDSDAVNLFTHMWHDHGDTIAIQYGGSHLVNTMATYRKINQWTSHSRDMVESFKRFYNNSFMDAQRQEAYNLFLGNYVFAQGQPMLWDLSTDYYLHHSDPRSMFGKRRPSYRHWYTDEYLEPPKIPPSLWPHELSDKALTYFDDYWVEYYRPLALTSFKKLFSFKMHSNLRYIPLNSTQAGRYDLSPFKVRSASNDHDNDNDSSSKAPATRRKGVKIIAPSDDTSLLSKDSSIDARISSAMDKNTPLVTPQPQSLGTWLDAHNSSTQQGNTSNGTSTTVTKPPNNRRYTGIIKETSFQVASSTPTVPKLPPNTMSNLSGSTMDIPPAAPPTKAELAQQAFEALITKSLSPTVPETEEYHRYVTHPFNIPLVVSSDIDYAKAPTEFLDYLSRTQEPPITTNPINSATMISETNHPGNGLERFPQPTNSILFDNYTYADYITLDERAEASLDDYAEFVDSGNRDDPLTVGEEDGGKKRYKAYRQWLRGKSLFKQRPTPGTGLSVREVN